MAKSPDPNMTWYDSNGRMIPPPPPYLPQPQPVVVVRKSQAVSHNPLLAVAIVVIALLVAAFLIHGVLVNMNAQDGCGVYATSC